MFHKPLVMVSPERGTLLNYYSNETLDTSLKRYRFHLLWLQFISYINLLRVTEDKQIWKWIGTMGKVKVITAHTGGGSFVFPTAMSLKKQCIAKVLETIMIHHG